MMATISRKTRQIIISSILASCVIISSNSQAINYVEDAKKYLEKGDYKSAIIQLKNQLKENPSDERARLLLGKSYLVLRDLKQANKEISRVYQLSPKNEDIALTYAQLLLLQQNYKKINKVLSIKFNDADKEMQSRALNAYAFLGQNQLSDAKQVFSELVTQTENANIYTGLAKIALLEKETDKATQWIDKSLKIAPDDFSALQTKASINIATKNYAEALNIYNQLIKLHENDLMLYLARAVIKIQQQDYQEAETDIKKILEKIPNHPQANYLLSQIQLMEKKYKQAEMSAQKVLNVMPRYYDAMLVLGVSHFGQSNYYQADKYLTQYLSVNSDNLNVQNVLANVYLAQKKSEQAILIIQGIDEDKVNNHAKILTTLGLAYLLAGEHKKGVDTLNKAKTLEPDSGWIQKKLIDGQIKSGDIGSAIIGLEKIVDTQQMDQKMNYLLLISYIQNKDFKKAEKRLNESIQKTPDDPSLFNIKAVIQKLTGNVQKTIDAYNQALKINAKYIPAYIGLADIATQQKDFSRAKALYSKILQINPKHVKAYIYLAAIASAQGNKAETESQLKKGFSQSEGDLRAQITVANFLNKWYVQQKTPEKIMPIAKKINKSYPNNELALSFLAVAQIENKQSERAEQTLKTIINKNETDVKHRLLLATLLAKKSAEENEVLELLDYVINIAPSNTRAIVFKSAYLLKNKQYQQAIDAGDYAMKTFPALPLGAQIKADAYRLDNKMDKALIHYREAYKLQPDNKMLFIISGILSYQGKEAESLKLLEGKLKGTDKDLAILFNIANIHQKNKDFHQAIEYYRKILIIKPENLLAMNNLAWAYAQEGNPQSLDLAKKTYEKAPKSAAIADTYGYIQLIMGDIASAVNLLEQAEKLAPKDYDIKFHLAEAYHLNGQNEKAKKILSAMLDSKSKFSEKEKAQALFNRLSERKLLER